MRAVLDALFDVIYRVYEVHKAAFRFVDYVASVVWSAVSYVFGAAVRLAIVILIQVLVIRGVHYCFFPPELSPKATPEEIRFAEFVATYPVLIAFALFFVGETYVVVFAFVMLRRLLMFKLEYVFESDQLDAKVRSYSPFDEESSAASDPLSF